MKYIFRGYTVFEYNPETQEVTQELIPNTDISAFDFCKWIPEDYKLLSEYFGTVYKHTQGEIGVNDLKNIVVD
jgi:hypothetical protein